MALRQVKDTPTNNFATWNILNYESHSFSQGNLSITSSGTGIAYANFSIPDSGKWYCEIRFNGGGNYSYLGVQPPLGGFSERFRILAKSDGNIYKNSSSGGVTHDFQGENYMSSWTDNDIISMMCDSDNEILTFYKNGAEITPNLPFNFTDFKHPDNRTRTFFTLCNSGLTHVANFGQNPTFSDTEPFAVTGGNNPDGSWSDANGQGSFYYQVPAGALALCSRNIQSVEQDGSYVQNYVSAKGNFRAVTYTGSYPTTNSVNVGFNPDLIWLKSRTQSYNHGVWDSIRTVNGYESLSTSNTNAQATSGDVISFITNGFRVDIGQAYNEAGQGDNNMVAWCWKAAGAPADGGSSVDGSARVINEDGTQADTTCDAIISVLADAGKSNIITPNKMSINHEAGFSIVQYQGISSDDTTLPTGLENPEFTIIKNISGGSQGGVAALWNVGVKGVTGTAKMLFLNENFAAGSSNQSGGAHTFEGGPSVHLYKGNGGNAQDYYRINQSGQQYIMYCWSSVPGYSAFGSYIGNNGGNFIYTGFRPAFVMFKKVNVASESWVIADNARDPANPTQKFLLADDPAVENSQPSGMYDFLSNGFVLKTQTQNNSETNFVYMAFAEQPGAFSNAR